MRTWAAERDACFGSHRQSWGAAAALIIIIIMFLQYYLNEQGDRVYTLQVRSLTAQHAAPCPALLAVPDAAHQPSPPFSKRFA